MNVLLLEDDDETAGRIARALARPETLPETRIDRFSNGDAALAAAAGGAYDVLILDRMVEGLEGLKVLQRLRAMDVRTPALFLSNLGQTRSRIEGLDAGADDYLSKPFDADELIARVGALLRRAGPKVQHDVIVVGDLEVRVKARTVHWRERFVDLSPKEFDILKLLAESQGQVLSRQMIWNGAWPEYRIPPQINVIDVNMSRLRAKLEQAAQHPLIETIRKQGFVLKANPN